MLKKVTNIKEKSKDIIIRQINDMRSNYLTTKDKLKNLLLTNIDLGLHHYYQDNFFDAKLRFKFVVLFCNKNCVEAIYNLGRCHYRENKIDKALKYFKKALESDATNEIVLYYMQKINNHLIIDHVPHKLYYECCKYSISKQYKNFEIVANIINQYFGDIKINILDIGCNIFYNQAILLDRKDCVFGVHFLSSIITKIQEGEEFYDNLGIITNDLKVDGALKYELIIGINILDGSNSFENILKFAKSKLLPGGLFIFNLLVSESENVVLDTKIDKFLFSKEFVKSVVANNNLIMKYSEQRDVLNSSGSKDIVYGVCYV